jgi:CBS domain-containing protein
MTKVQDVMTRNVAAVQAATPFKRIAELIVERKVSAVPVIDTDGIPIGVVSEADLITRTEFPAGRRHASFLDRVRHDDELAKSEATVAAELMTGWPTTIRPDADLAEAARRMLRARVKRLLVVDRARRLIGIVTRSDLLKVFLRADADIRAEVLDGVLARRMALDPLRFTVKVRDGKVTLYGQLERRSQMMLAEDLVLAVPGVVGVENLLSWELDDTHMTLPPPAIPWTWM